MEPVSHDNAGSRRMRCGGDPARSAEAGRLVCPMGDSGAVGGPGGRRAPTSTEVRHVNVPFSHPSGGRGQKDGRKVRSRGELPLTLAHDARSSSPRRGEPSSRTSGCGRTACASPAGAGTFGSDVLRTRGTPPAPWGQLGANAQEITRFICIYAQRWTTQRTGPCPQEWNSMWLQRSVFPTCGQSCGKLHRCFSTCVRTAVDESHRCASPDSQP